MSTPGPLRALLFCLLLVATVSAAPPAGPGGPGQARSEEKEIREWEGVPWAEASLLKGDHYRLTANCPRKAAREYLLLLESAHDGLASLFDGLPLQRPSGLADVYILRSYDGFLDLTGKRRVAGFYSPTEGPAVPARTVLTYHGARVGVEGDTRRVLLHQAAIQFQDIALDGHWNAPIWLVQGTAVLFETSRIDGEKVIFQDEETSRFGAVTRERLRPLWDGFEPGSGRYVPLEHLFRTPPSQFRSYHQTHAWSLVHWMVNGDDGKHRPLFGALIRQALEKECTPESVEKLIQKETGLGIDDFEREVWKPYVLGLVPEPTGVVEGDGFTSGKMKMKISRPGSAWDWVLEDLPVDLQVRMENLEAEAKIDVSAQTNRVSPADLRERGLKGLLEDAVKKAKKGIADETPRDLDGKEGFFEEIDLSGRKAGRFAYTGWKGGARAKLLVVIPTVRRNYEIRCECPPEQAEALQADFDKVIRSFQIVP